MGHEEEEREPRAQQPARRAAISGSCAAAVAGISALVLRWRSIDFGDLPTWLATVAAVVGGTVALYQLREQRRAISEEFARQAKRDALLDAQLERSHVEREALLRAQAEHVDLLHARRPSDGGPIQMTIVKNNSRRPIRNVRAFLRRPGEDWIPADAIEESIRPRLVAGSTYNLLRADDRVMFAFDVRVEVFPDVARCVEFSDDAGLRWRIDDDLSLHRIEQFMELQPEQQGPSTGA